MSELIAYRKLIPRQYLDLCPDWDDLLIHGITEVIKEIKRHSDNADLLSIVLKVQEHQSFGGNLLIQAEINGEFVEDA